LPFFSGFWSFRFLLPAGYLPKARTLKTATCNKYLNLYQNKITALEFASASAQIKVTGLGCYKTGQKSVSKPNNLFFFFLIYF